MLEEKITEVIDKLVELGEKLGTPAFDAVVRGVYLEGVFTLMMGGVTLILVVLLSCGCWSFIKAAVTEDDKPRGEQDGACLTLYVVGALASGFFALFSGIASLVSLINMSAWIAAVDPVAEVARRIVAGG